jgi:hypothetical protein
MIHMLIIYQIRSTGMPKFTQKNINSSRQITLAGFKIKMVKRLVYRISNNPKNMLMKLKKISQQL